MFERRIDRASRVGGSLWKPCHETAASGVIRRDAQQLRKRVAGFLVLLRQRVGAAEIVEHVRVAWRAGMPSLEIRNCAGGSERELHALIVRRELHGALQAAQRGSLIPQT